MLPEEKELVRLEAEQAELKDQVISAELALETIKGTSKNSDLRKFLRI
jgi:hypothetical protein